MLCFSTVWFPNYTGPEPPLIAKAKKNDFQKGMVAHVFNPSTQEAQAGGKWVSMSSRLGKLRALFSL